MGGNNLTLKNTAMKKLKLIMLLCIVLAAFNMNAYAQDLPPVTVQSLNYKYIRSVYDTSAAQPVRLLERRVASYDVKASEFYEEDFNDYFISFYLPHGHVLATYDNEGKLLRTAERFKNIALPPLVRQSIVRRYPGWNNKKDIYVVNYSTESDKVKKVYKVVLENGDKRLRVKTDEKGEFIERD
jgi:hypothetical protein